VVYVALLGFDLIAIVWTWLLLFEGTMVANGFTRIKSVFVTGSMLTLTGVCAVAIGYV
jgi:hypothetical protein